MNLLAKLPRHDAQPKEAVVVFGGVEDGDQGTVQRNALVGLRVAQGEGVEAVVPIRLHVCVGEAELPVAQ